MLGSGHLQHRNVGLSPFLGLGFPLANLSQGIYNSTRGMASDCARHGSGWILGKFLHGKGGQALTWAVVESLSLKVLKKYMDVTPGDMVSTEHGSAGLDSKIWEGFSNFGHSVTLK